jgi:aconitate decarboxylase
MGVEAALLAELGWTANDSILEAPSGFGEALFPVGEFDTGKAVAGFGEKFMLTDPGPIYKLYPAQYTTHWSIVAILRVRREHQFSLAEVRSVDVRVGADNPAGLRPHPSSGLEGKFSLQYTCAVALLDGDVTIDSFSDARWKSSDLRNMMDRINVIFDHGIQSTDFTCAWSEVTVHTTTGIYSARCDSPRGHFDNPANFDDLRRKFRDCAQRAVDDVRISAIEEAVVAMDRLEDVGDLARLLR